jgi:hypothetical protein
MSKGALAVQRASASVTHRGWGCPWLGGMTATVMSADSEA